MGGRKEEMEGEGEGGKFSKRNKLFQSKRNKHQNKIRVVSSLYPMTVSRLTEIKRYILYKVTLYFQHTEQNVALIGVQ